MGEGMVSREIYSQGILLASCVGLGAWLMVCYDLLRIFRMLLPHKSWAVSLEDLLYWMYVTWSAFSLLYRQNDGGLRGCAIGGMFLGMVCYDKAVSRNVMKVLQKFTERIRMKVQREKKLRKTAYIKSGDADEELRKKVQEEEAGQVGKPDGAGRRYGGGRQPGRSGKFQKRFVKRKGFGLSAAGGSPAGPERTGDGEEG